MVMQSSQSHVDLLHIASSFLGSSWDHVVGFIKHMASFRIDNMRAPAFGTNCCDNGESPIFAGSEGTMVIEDERSFLEDLCIVY